MAQAGHTTTVQVAGRHIPGVGMVAVAATLWGTDGLFRRGLALDLPAATVVVYEHAILVLMIAPLLPRVWRATRNFGPGQWLAAVLIGAGASATATMLFTAAFRYGDPTTPLLLQKLQPFIAILGAALILSERLRPRFLGYLGVAVIGAYLISFSDPTAVTIASATPALLAVGAAILWGLGTVLGRLLLADIQTMDMTALRFAIGLPAAALICLIDQGTPGFAIRGSDLLSIFVLALVPGLLALSVYYRGLAATPASSATLAELAFPLSAVVLNYVFFGTTLTATQWVGVLAVVGTIVVMARSAAAGHPEALGVTLPVEDGSSGKRLVSTP